MQQLEPHDVSWLAVRGSDDFTRLTRLRPHVARRRAAIRVHHAAVSGFRRNERESRALSRARAARGVGAHHVSRRPDRSVGASARRRRAGDAVRAESGAAESSSVRPRDARAASAKLREAGVTHSLREGAIRLSPHCYNTSAEIDYALSIIAPSTSARILSEPRTLRERSSVRRDVDQCVALRSLSLRSGCRTRTSTSP